ncbi:MarR family winged helix-turn-helix transcriptional regulator [Alkalisalibacterium limincola]|uniref:Winged helix-turn-helix transcriptional regulator n=1 Tax=Alkalisalibacterium limincola TaxID=2699169 RepID=A0A5C8KHB4_9GAMM|nr:MarR family winged helix-turn-helix transcriptional regulator [Alkalisalibacterium limincola]TXK59840.1 winged helix-turn-helix transcriptional regulator [Alkalisalibacterium limincola]
MGSSSTPLAPEAAQLDLEHFLPYRLSVLSNRLSNAIARSYQQRFGLSVTEWRVLAVIGRYPGVSASEVAERTAMDKVAVSRAVGSLLAAGRIARDTHGEDRRRSVLHLTDAGEAIHAEVVPMALGYERALLSVLDAGERRTLGRLLDKLDGNGDRAAQAL